VEEEASGEKLEGKIRTCLRPELTTAVIVITF
jgi:hypothetical protein